MARKCFWIASLPPHDARRQDARCQVNVSYLNKRQRQIEPRPSCARFVNGRGKYLTSTAGHWVKALTLQFDWCLRLKGPGRFGFISPRKTWHGSCTQIDSRPKGPRWRTWPTGTGENEITGQSPADHQGPCDMQRVENQSAMGVAAGLETHFRVIKYL